VGDGECIFNAARIVGIMPETIVSAAWLIGSSPATSPITILYITSLGIAFISSGNSSAFVFKDSIQASTADWSVKSMSFAPLKTFSKTALFVSSKAFTSF